MREKSRFIGWLAGRAQWALLACVFGSTWGAPAYAQRELSQRQPDSWYIIHGSLTATAAAASAGLSQGTSIEPLWSRSARFERRVEGNYAPLTSHATDYTLTLAMLAPVVAFAGERSAPFFGNASLIYFEAMSFSAALNRMVKITVRRTRPFVHNRDPIVQTKVEPTSADANQSFYSGHSSASFTSATAGALLFSASDRPEAAEAAFWMFEMALAGFTATGRVRGGNHYPSDVVVGAVVGTGLGLLIPWSHGVPIEVSPAHWAGMSGGVVLGVGVGLFFPRIAAELQGLALEPQPGGLTLGYQSSF